MRLESAFAHHAARRPNHTALVCGASRLTYGELARSVAGLASGLAAHGVGHGDRVLVALPNGIPLVQLIYAAFTVGAVVVPVTNRLTAHEIAHIAGDIRPALLAYDAAARDTFAAIDADGAVRVTTGHAIAGELAFDDLLGTSPAPVIARDAVGADHDDALILYTSGTTGRPKGAILTHANMIVQNVFMHGLAWHLDESDRFLVMTALAHRAGVSRLFNAFGLGGTLVVMEKFDAEEALATIERERITMTGLVPTVIRMMLPALRAAPERARSLEKVSIGTEACPPSLKEEVMRLLPGVAVHSVYAMTEALVTDITGPEQLARPDSVGRALPWVELRLLDDAGRDVPAGEAGEIAVRSGAPGAFAVLRGYYNRPTETAQALRDGWFHTGDMGRLDSEGYLTVVDRKKDMVISGGFNIYSKEVEQALMSHPGVMEAAVIGVPDDVFGEAVAAYVHTTPQSQPDADALLAHCRERLAGYKKPKHVFFVDALPKNGSGKVLKNALRADAAKRLQRSS